MLDLEVTLTSLISSKWEICLGAPFCHCVTVLQQFSSEIKSVQVWYSDQNPLGNDMVLKLSDDGIRLMFDPYTQRLKIIEIYDMEKVMLRYHGKHFNSPTTPPTIDQIRQSFGSTTPCKSRYYQNQQTYEMNFRGLTFTFTADGTSQAVLEDRTGLSRIELPPGIIPKVTKMSIYCGPSKFDCVSPEVPLSILNGSHLASKLLVERSDVGTTGVVVSLLSPDTEASSPAPHEDGRKSVDRRLNFGMSCQEVTSAIGSPNKVFYKSEDKMRIHAQDALRHASASKSDYIYNYFSLGLDLVFDGLKHTLLKFIFHTNYPGHYDFNIFMRCPFEIPLKYVAKPGNYLIDPYQQQLLTITPYTKWNDIEQFFFNGAADCCPKPVVLKRASSVNSTNPFGYTFCYGIQDMIFEVMENRHIASVVIYQQQVDQ